MICRTTSETDDETPDTTSGCSEYLYIQMELCKRKSLKERLQDEPTKDDPERIRIYREIVSAVDYLHSSGLMHRDLKVLSLEFKNVK